MMMMMFSMMMMLVSSTDLFLFDFREKNFPQGGGDLEAALHCSVSVMGNLCVSRERCRQILTDLVFRQENCASRLVGTER